MPTDLELLVGKKKTVKVNGKNFEIGKLSLGQTLKFVDIILRFCISSAGKLKGIDGESNFADAITLLKLVPQDQVAELIAVFLDIDDIKFCEKISTEEISEIILAVCEINDIGKIVKNFSGAYKIVKSRLKPENEKK